MGAQTEVVRKSFAAVVHREPRLVHRFCDVLFCRHPQMRALVHGRDPEGRERLLRDALVAVVDHLEDRRWLAQTLTALGARHAASGITDDMYDWAGAALLQAVGDAAGPDWTPEVAEAWTDVYAGAAALLKHGAQVTVFPARPLAAEQSRPH